MELMEIKQLVDTYHAAGRSREDTVAIVSAVSINGEESEAFEYVDLVHKSEPAQSEVEYPLTDSGNAEFFTALYGDKLRYDHHRNRWLEWLTHCWRPEHDGHIMRLALKATRQRYRQAVNVADLGFREKIAKWAISSEQRARLEACIAIARNLKPIADSGENWDWNGWLFCVRNGVIDLRSGELRPGKPEDMITMQSPVECDRTPQCPLWIKFIGQVTDGNAALQSYLQRSVGYSLTGETKGQLWFFLYGLGSNGKTTFTMTIRRLMGDYGVRLDSDDLMIKDRRASGSNPKEGIADTRGKRFAVASEVQDGKRLDIGLLKDMSGQDTIKARRLYEHETEFLPTHKLWMFGNHKPIIADTTHAAWRRLKLIPFTFIVPDNEIDLDLQSKLENELPGILNWAVDGCLQWQKEGLDEPNVVTDAVAAYRHEQDILSDFIEDCCILEPLATIPKADLKDEYQKWCQDNSVEPVTQRTFRARLVEKDIGEGRSSDGKTRVWRGIRLKTNTDISDKTNGNLALTDKNRLDLPESPHMRNENETLLGKTGNSCQIVRNDTENEPFGDNPSWPAYADLLDMAIPDVLALWEDRGRPGIELAPGNAVTDLRTFFAQPDVDAAHLLALKEWLNADR